MVGSGSMGLGWKVCLRIATAMAVIVADVLQSTGIAQVRLL
jgi:hypothetical protein